jgi:hypothetical protein
MQKSPNFLSVLGFTGLRMYCALLFASMARAYGLFAILFSARPNSLTVSGFALL